MDCSLLGSSVQFSRPEYWSGLPCPPPGCLPDPEMEPMSLLSRVLAGGFFTTSATWEVLFALICALKLDILVAYLFYEL